MIKNIVFDMGNVLIRYDVNNYVHELADNEEDRDILRKELFGSVEWLQMDRGILESVDAVNQIKARVPDRLHKAIEQGILEWHMDLENYKDMEDFTSMLKEKGYHLYLLSNTSKKFHIFRKFIPALRNFDGEFISADHKLMKPEPEIFKAFYEEYHLKPEECYFIDDTVSNIESALFTGMQGFVFRGDIDALKEDMSKKGIDVM